MNANERNPPNFRLSEKLAVDVKGLREVLDVGNTKAWQLIRDGEVESFSIGRKRLIVVESIGKLVRRLVHTANAERATPGSDTPPAIMPAPDTASPGRAACPAALKASSASARGGR
jgi:hypothetical protein